jgi:hypothetical protein
MHQPQTSIQSIAPRGELAHGLGSRRGGTGALVRPHRAAAT